MSNSGAPLGFRFRVRLFLFPLCLLVTLAASTPADAALVYVRPNAAMPEPGDVGDIVAANDDGSNPRVIAHGHHPLISPDGRHVVYFSRSRSENDSLRIVPVGGGRSRLLLGDSFAEQPGPPFAWSHDSRHVAAAAEGPRGTVVDVRSRKRRNYEFDFQFGGASFSPDDSDLVFVNQALRDSALVLAYTGRRGSRTFARGAFPVWVGEGIFFSRDGVKVLRRPGSRARTVYRPPSAVVLFTIGSSADGHTVLAAQGPSDHQLSPVLIAAKSHAAVSVPAVFSEIDAVSRHGKLVLGVADGNVVVAARDGTTRVLAAGAISPSWTG